MTFRRIIPPLLGAALLSGCFTMPEHARFFFLSAPAPEPATPVQTNRVFLVGLRTTAADFLRTRQMIVETGPNQLQLSVDNVWQETPQAGFSRLLAGCFAHELPDCQFTTLPVATTNTPEFTLDIQLTEMQGRLKPAGEAVVSVEVRILDAAGRLLERDELRKTVPWNPSKPPNNYPGLAAAESVAANEVAGEIGERLLALRRKNTN